MHAGGRRDNRRPWRAVGAVERVTAAGHAATTAREGAPFGGDASALDVDVRDRGQPGTASIEPCRVALRATLGAVLAA